MSDPIPADSAADSAPVLSTPADQPAQRDKVRVPAPWTWWIATAVGVLLWAAVGAALPVSLKPLGPYAWIWGALAGGTLGFAATQSGVRITTALVIWLGFWLVVGETGQVLVNYQRYTQLVQQEQAKIPRLPGWKQASQLPADPMLSAEDQQAQREFQQALAEMEQRLRDRMAFRTFLARRMSAKSPPASPWPELFWGLEILGGTFLGVVACRSLSRSV